MKSKYIIYIATIITVVAVVFSAFIYISHAPSQNESSISPQGTSFVDDEGTVTTLTSVPQRIVSLTPSATQILFAIGAGDKVVGVTSYDNYPYNFSAWAAAGNMTIDGGYGSPNMETIATLHPDLIIGDTINDASYPSMRALGWKVIVLNPTTVAGIEQDIMLVGRATENEAQATQVVDNITGTIDNIAAKIAAANITTTPTVYYEMYSIPLMSAGATNWVSDAIAKAGGINIFENESQAWLTISSETVVKMNPDVIFLPSGTGGMAQYGSIAQVEARPGWNTVSAVQNNRIYIVNQDLFEEPGPRVAELIQNLADCLYPQLFNATSTSSTS
jgi:iron complex transport system substrate-binding protein